MIENLLAHFWSSDTKHLIRLSSPELMNNHGSHIRSLLIYQLMNHFMKLSALTLTGKGSAPSKAISLFRPVTRHKHNTVKILYLLTRPTATSVLKRSENLNAHCIFQSDPDSGNSRHKWGDKE